MESTAHWSQRYVGRNYAEAEFDCADLARLVLREVFGREIRLPSERWYRGKSGRARVRAMNEQILSCRDDYAARTETPGEGDAVLLLSRGRNDHIGLYCVIGAEPYVMHCADRPVGQAVLCRVRDLPARGYAVEGFYKWT